MSGKYQNKYRIASARLQSWDYGNNGSYFITICTKNREHFFGKIAEQEMHLNETGKLAEQYWVEIPEHYPFIELGNFVVMPNHMHGILIIENSDPKTEPQSIPAGKGGFAGEKNPMFHDNISRVVRWYKGRCTFEIHKINLEFDWQRSFHDHIIRDTKSFERIQNYIANNPKNWNDDKFYS